MVSDTTVICESCGYDLQGLPVGANCPECGDDKRKVKGENIQEEEGHFLRLINANLAVKGLEPMPEMRTRVKHWMKLGGLFVFSLFLLQLLVTFAAIPIGLYRLVLFGLSIFWPIVVVGMLPAKADASMPPVYKWIRMTVPFTQWCWPAGFVLWLVLHVPQEEYTLGGNVKYFPIILFLHAVGGIGLTGIAFWLHDFALRLNLPTAAKRCNLFAIATVTWGFFVFVLPWQRFAAANLGEIGFLFYAYIMVLMLPWLWVVYLFGRALFEFASDANWSLRYDDGLEGRQERISKKRKEYERKRGW